MIWEAEKDGDSKSLRRGGHGGEDFIGVFQARVFTGSDGEQDEVEAEYRDQDDDRPHGPQRDPAGGGNRSTSRSDADPSNNGSVIF